MPRISTAAPDLHVDTVSQLPGEVRCINCGSTRRHVRYTFDNVATVIQECDGCHLMVLDPMPDEEALHEVYNQGYFENNQLAQADVSKVFGYIDYAAERMNKQRGYEAICAHLARLTIPSRRPALLLDYGCGLGFFLDSAFEAGFEPHGVEFNHHALAYIGRRYAYRAFHFSELERTPTKYDVVTLFDVIEHLRDPLDTIRAVHGLLAENGLFVVTTMDSTSLTSRIFGKRLEDFRRIREHLFFFSRGNLASILMRQGFEIVKLESHGHSFELQLLATRLGTVLPVVSTAMLWLLRLFPPAGRWTIYLNPRTKFIVYARKRRERMAAPPATATLSIVVPVYNESGTIAAVLDRLVALQAGVYKEIIVVDDGSTDSTSNILEEYSARGEIRLIALQRNSGKGAAIAAGIRASTGEYVVVQDADTEYNPADIPALLQAMAQSGALVVYGSRFSGQYRRTGAFLPTVANRILTLATNVVTNLNLSDVMTGYKLFDGNLIRKLPLRSPGFEVEAEITCRIARMGVPIFEAPISYNARTYLEGKKIRARDGWRALMAIVRHGLFGA